MTKTRTKTTKKVITSFRKAGFAVTAVAALLLIPFLLRGLASIAYAAHFQQKEPAPYALIFGTVWDKNDIPVYGVVVKIRPVDKKKAKWELMSDHAGEFAQRVPAGKADYVVWADVKTPKGTPKPQKTVHIENDERVDISLHLTD